MFSRPSIGRPPIGTWTVPVMRSGGSTSMALTARFGIRISELASPTRPGADSSRIEASVDDRRGRGQGRGRVGVLADGGVLDGQVVAGQLIQDVGHPPEARLHGARDPVRVGQEVDLDLARVAQAAE